MVMPERYRTQISALGRDLDQKHDRKPHTASRSKPLMPSSALIRRDLHYDRKYAFGDSGVVRVLLRSLLCSHEISLSMYMIGEECLAGG